MLIFIANQSIYSIFRGWSRLTLSNFQTTPVRPYPLPIPMGQLPMLIVSIIIQTWHFLCHESHPHIIRPPSSAQPLPPCSSLTPVMQRSDGAARSNAGVGLNPLWWMMTATWWWWWWRRRRRRRFYYHDDGKDGKNLATIARMMSK